MFLWSVQLEYSSRIISTNHSYLEWWLPIAILYQHLQLSCSTILFQCWLEWWRSMRQHFLLAQILSPAWTIFFKIMTEWLMNQGRASRITDEVEKELAGLVNVHDLEMPGQSHNRVNGWSNLHVSGNGAEVLWLYNVRNITVHCNMAGKIRCERRWKSLVAHLPHFQFSFINNFLPIRCSLNE